MCSQVFAIRFECYYFGIKGCARTEALNGTSHPPPPPPPPSIRDQYSALGSDLTRLPSFSTTLGHSGGQASDEAVGWVCVMVGAFFVDGARGGQGTDVVRCSETG